MIKNADYDTKTLKLDIFLKDGKYYLEKDMPVIPFGENDQIISFWEGNIAVIIPMSEVKCILMYDGNVRIEEREQMHKTIIPWQQYPNI